MYEEGFALLKSNNFSEALSYFEGYLQKNSPSRAKLLYGKARACIGLKQYKNAYNILNYLIENNSTWLPPYLTLARMLEELRYFALAELTYKKALRIDPENQNVKDHYQFFLKTYVNGNEYLQACRVYIPGYANIQEKPAFNEEENLEKALELFEKSSFYRK